MCHQSVGLIARHLEAAGFPTIGLTSARTITAAANPPRSVFLDAPLGHTAGPPGDATRQREVIRSALEAGAAMSEPGSITDLELRWHHDEWKSTPMGWSRSRERRRESGTVAEARGGDSRTERSPEPQYQNDADRSAAEARSWDEQCLTCVGLPDPA